MSGSARRQSGRARLAIAAGLVLALSGVLYASSSRQGGSGEVAQAGVEGEPAGTVSQAGRVPLPSITIEKKGKCVRDTGFMRRNHMELLKHQRDETVRLGVRGTDISLQGCIDCHASPKTGSVAAAREDFCQTCHAYAAVKLDCFECHSPKARVKQAAVGEGR